MSQPPPDPAPPPPFGPRKSILIVDDEPSICRTLEAILRRDGHHVVTASNGIEALTKLRAGYTPDLILLDLMMPLMDGEEFLEEIRKYRGKLAEVPVVITSALDPRQGLPWLARLNKPFSVEGVRAILKDYAR